MTISGMARVKFPIMPGTIMNGAKATIVVSTPKMDGYRHLLGSFDGSATRPGSPRSCRWWIRSATMIASVDHDAKHEDEREQRHHVDRDAGVGHRCERAQERDRDADGDPDCQVHPQEERQDDENQNQSVAPVAHEQFGPVFQQDGACPETWTGRVLRASKPCFCST